MAAIPALAVVLVDPPAPNCEVMVVEHTGRTFSSRTIWYTSPANRYKETYLPSLYIDFFHWV